MSQQHQILVGDCIEMMRTLPDKSVQQAKRLDCSHTQFQGRPLRHVPA